MIGYNWAIGVNHDNFCENQTVNKTLLLINPLTSNHIVSLRSL